MKVKDLISFLQKCNQDKDVYLSYNEWCDHWTYEPADDVDDEDNGVYICGCDFSATIIRATREKENS